MKINDLAMSLLGPRFRGDDAAAIRKCSAYGEAIVLNGKDLR
jgi:hypothetical protein